MEYIDKYLTVWANSGRKAGFDLIEYLRGRLPGGKGDGN